MVNNAQEYEAADKAKRDQVDLRNQSDSLCYQAEKQVKEMADKISSDDKNKLESLIQQLKDSIQSENFESMKSLNKELEQELMSVGQKVYSQAQANSNQNTGAICS